MSISRSVTPAARVLHAVAVLADRRPHTVRELAIPTILVGAYVHRLQATREALAPLVEAGVIHIVGRGVPSNGRGPFLYQLAHLPESSDE